MPTASPTPPRAVVDLDVPGPTISRHIYGHFAEHLGRCIYGGLYVGEDSSIPNIHGLRRDVIAALRSIAIPNLRWPGGCFADEYHWRDGIGPRDQRPTMVNTNWGEVLEDNSFGTHEFMELCELLGAAPYITGNVGSGTVQEMSEWVDYLTREGDCPMARLRRANGRKDPWQVPFFGIGNEPWGCGGNMSAQVYTAQARRYATFIRSHGEGRMVRIAAGANADDYEWTDTLMRDLVCDISPYSEPAPYQAISLHSYTFADSFEAKGQARGFSTDAWYAVFANAWRMEELLTRHSTVMDRYDPLRTVGLVVDEWGAWWEPKPGTNPHFLQQDNTLRDALIASLHFDVFHRHAERVVMANLAQLVNVLQAPILTDPGTGTMVLTPTYHVLAMNVCHHDATRLDVNWVDDLPVHAGVCARPFPVVSVSASRKEGSALISATNLDAETAHTIRLDLRGAAAAVDRMLVLTADALDAHNTPGAPDTVKPVVFSDWSLCNGVLELVLPRAGYVTASLELGS
ncbi:alpha-N-arabinofuranosidase [Actinomyces qiguomingii]|uniref:alpha-N-arabinofuranosidase n=1 Tax=Actinomyces qiguomingii TaxID=2057800 RepID=UPI000CA03388|nr:alpha-L-arabinofuranosidase C-terminal domain-containing protein [Actinomyces qiguomingii]